MCKPTAIIYARQSYTHEADSTSIAVQLSKCREWCHQHRVDVIGTYQDAGVSSELYPDTPDGRRAAEIDAGYQAWRGSQLTAGRPEYKAGLGQAFAAIADKHPTYIVVYTANRIGRCATGSYLDRYITSYLMQHKCSRVESMTGAVLDFSDAVMTLFSQVRDALDYIGLAEKREAALASIHRRIDSYRVVSNAFGAVTAKDGTITFPPRHAAAIRYVYDAVCGGATYGAVLQHLNTNYRDICTGRQYYSSNIRHILNNLAYAGMARDRQGVIDKATNIPQPVISYAQWVQAQHVVATRKVGRVKCNLSGHRRCHWLPLSGYLTCACGRRLTMRTDRGHIAYMCINDGDHTTRLVTDSENHGQDVIRSLQSLFIVHCIRSRQELESCKSIDAEVDTLQTAVDAKAQAIRARMALVADMDDVAMFRADFAKLNDELSALKNQLSDARMRQTADTAAAREKIETDFAQIMDGQLLPEDDYQRLLAETIDHIAVADDSVTVCLTDGHSFTLPRITIDKRGKKILPWSEIYADTDEAATLEGIMHYSVVFHCGNDDQTETVLLDADGYDVRLTR